MPAQRISSRQGVHAKRSSNRTSVTKRRACTYRRRTCAHKAIRSKQRHGCTRKSLGVHARANSGGRDKHNGGSLATIAENVKNNTALKRLGKHLFDHSPVVIPLQAHGILLITINVAATYPAFYSMTGFTRQLAETYSQWRNTQVYEYITQLIAITSSNYIICLQEADKTLYDLLLQWPRVTEGKTFLTDFHTEVNRTHEGVPFHYGLFAISSDKPNKDDDLCKYPQFEKSLLLETVNHPTKAGEHVRTRNVRAHMMTFSPNLNIANGHFRWIDTTKNNYSSSQLEHDTRAIQTLFDMADIVIGDFNGSSPFWKTPEIIKVSGDIKPLGYSKKHIKGQPNNSFTVGTDDAIRFKNKQEYNGVTPVSLLEHRELITEPKMMLRFKDYLNEKETESLKKADEYRSELLVLEREKLSSLKRKRSPSLKRKSSSYLTRSPSIQRKRSASLTRTSSRTHSQKKPKPQES